MEYFPWLAGGKSSLWFAMLVSAIPPANETWFQDFQLGGIFSKVQMNSETDVTTLL